MPNVQSFERADFFQQVKADLHRKILDRLDLEKLGKTSGDSARDEVLVVIRSAVNSEVVPLSFAERERLPILFPSQREDFLKSQKNKEPWLRGTALH